MDLQNTLIMAFGTVDQRQSLTSIRGESLQMFPKAPVRQWVLSWQHEQEDSAAATAPERVMCRHRYI
jgi:hypothetical protein